MVRNSTAYIGICWMLSALPAMSLPEGTWDTLAVGARGLASDGAGGMWMGHANDSVWHISSSGETKRYAYPIPQGMTRWESDGKIYCDGDLAYVNFDRIRWGEETDPFSPYEYSETLRLR